MTKVKQPISKELVRAFITLSAESATKLIDAGSVKIGWIRAKIRVSIAKDGIAASRIYRDSCIRGGRSEHKMKDCKAVPKYVQ